MTSVTSFTECFSERGSIIVAAEDRFWIIMIFLNPFEVLNGSIKSIAIDSKGVVGVGNVVDSPAGLFR